MTPEFQAIEITKSFGPTLALDKVSINFVPGEVHAVLGENGAGKSTLMNILSGAIQPDTGSLKMAGELLQLSSPQSAIQKGIGMVHQHFMLVPAFTVEENLALVRVDRLAKTISLSDLARRAMQWAHDLGWNQGFQTSSRTGDLPVGVQQRLEILKVLAADPRIIIFDEPTAALTPDEVEDLLRVLNDLRARGTTIILIAHKLSEVMAIADRYTILRKGKFIATARRGEASADQLAEWMVGEVPKALQSDTRKFGPVVVQGASFTIRKSEIVGFGGVDGNGQNELAESLVGLAPAPSDLTVPTDVAYIPQDRRRDGLVLTMSIAENLALSDLPANRLGLIDFSKLRDRARALVEKFKIKIGQTADPVSTLSGGNQQKIVVARNLDRVPQLLVALNPTRGLDVAATRFVHEQILRAATDGAAVALFSTDQDELSALSHQIYTMSRGSVIKGNLKEALRGEA